MYINNIMKKISLPFTTEKKGKSKSFKILHDNDFEKKLKKGGNSLFNEIKRIISNNSNNNNNNNSKIKYIKASESLKYQKK